jgi:hypothetical protein
LLSVANQSSDQGSDGPSHQLPYDDIEANPVDYYDISKYGKDFIKNPLSPGLGIMDLASMALALQKGDFDFYDRDVVQAKILSHAPHVDQDARELEGEREGEEEEEAGDNAESLDIDVESQRDEPTPSNNGEGQGEGTNLDIDTKSQRDEPAPSDNGEGQGEGDNLDIDAKSQRDEPAPSDNGKGQGEGEGEGGEKKPGDEDQITESDTEDEIDQLLPSEYDGCKDQGQGEGEGEGEGAGVGEGGAENNPADEDDIVNIETDSEQDELSLTNNSGKGEGEGEGGDEQTQDEDKIMETDDESRGAGGGLDDHSIQRKHRLGERMPLAAIDIGNGSRAPQTRGSKRKAELEGI